MIGNHRGGLARPAFVVVACAVASVVLATELATIATPAGATSVTAPVPAPTPVAVPPVLVPVAVPPVAVPPVLVPPVAVPPAVPPVAVPPAVPPVAVPPARQVTDRVDRSWPANPPWDACPRPVWPGRTSVGEPGAGRRVLLIGDSLTRESRTATARTLRAHGWTPTFRCWGSRRLDWGIAQVTRARQLRELPGVVVVALGTNDISWVDEATTARRVDTLLDRLGPRRTVLWVDLHLTRSAWLDARAARFNAMLRAQARRRPNLTVVGWHAVANAHHIRGWDGIHYGPDGYRLRAQVVGRAVDAALAT